MLLCTNSNVADLRPQCMGPEQVGPLPEATTITTLLMSSAFYPVSQ